MATPEVYISTPLTVITFQLVGESRIVHLPPASTILGQSFWIADTIGGLGTGNLFTILTTGIDKFDNSTNTINLTNKNQSIRLYAQNLSNYAVLQNNRFSW
jgi:hypothetical protein